MGNKQIFPGFDSDIIIWIIVLFLVFGGGDSFFGLGNKN